MGRRFISCAVLGKLCPATGARHAVRGTRCAARGARQTRVLAGYARLRIEGSIVINSDGLGLSAGIMHKAIDITQGLADKNGNCSFELTPSFISITA